jgi:chaperonin GroES
MSTFKPIGDRVAVKPQPADERTAGGLYVPDTAKEKPQQGTVVAVGDGRIENGERIALQVKEGDAVLYGKYAGTEITLDGEDLLIMKESDLLGRIED